MNDAEARRLSIDLLETAETAIVTSIDAEGFPQTRAMFNLRRKEQFPGLAGLCKDQLNILHRLFYDQHLVPEDRSDQKQA